MNVRSSWRIGHAAIDREARLDTNCNALPIKYQPTVEIISPAVASPTGSNCSHLVWRRPR